LEPNATLGDGALDGEVELGRLPSAGRRHGDGARSRGGSMAARRRAGKEEHRGRTRRRESGVGADGGKARGGVGLARRRRSDGRLGGGSRQEEARRRGAGLAGRSGERRPREGAVSCACGERGRRSKDPIAKRNRGAGV
jgi:hypothetical protein